MIKITSLPKSLQEVQFQDIPINTPFFCNKFYIKSSENTAVNLSNPDCRVNTFSPGCLVQLVELEIQVKWKIN